MSDDEKNEQITVKITGPGVQIERAVAAEILPSLMSLLMGKIAVGTFDAPIPPSTSAPPGGRLSIVEYLREKQPRSMPETIAVMARYAEVYDRKTGITREEIRRYMTVARVPEPANFPRDFQAAIGRGLIHSAGGDNAFQVTRTGVEILDHSGPAKFPRPPGARRRSRQQHNGDEG